MQVKCDLGTDCSDCGAFTHYMHRKPDSNSSQPAMPSRPIELLTKRGIEVLHLVLPDKIDFASHLLWQKYLAEGAVLDSEQEAARMCMPGYMQGLGHVSLDMCPTVIRCCLP